MGKESRYQSPSVVCVSDTLVRGVGIGTTRLELRDQIHHTTTVWS